MSVPSPGDSGSETQLTGVRCVSPKDCWAVGYSRKGSNPDLNVTLHWNSAKWTSS